MENKPASLLVVSLARHLRGRLHLYVAHRWPTRIAPRYNCEVPHPACRKRLLLGTHQWQSALLKCQQAKVIRHNRAPLHSYKTPNERLLHIHVDIIGPLPVSHGYSYLLSIICCFTRHVELVSLRDATAIEWANAFLLHWVGRFGCPTQMTTDRGRQFTSYL